MNELDSILDAEAGLSFKSFRTGSGHCRIYSDRVELVKSNDAANNFFSSPSFIIRIVIFFGLLGLLLFYRFEQGPAGLEYAYLLAVPAAIVLLSIIGNINVFLFRLRSVLFIALFIFFTYLEYDRGNTSTVFLYLIFIVFLFYGFIRSFDYSYPSSIERKNILAIKFINSIPLLTRAYFLVNFLDEKGKRRKRPIMLPGFLKKGEQEKKIAVSLMKEEGLMS